MVPVSVTSCPVSLRSQCVRAFACWPGLLCWFWPIQSCVPGPLFVAFFRSSFISPSSYNTETCSDGGAAGPVDGRLDRTLASLPGFALSSSAGHHGEVSWLPAPSLADHLPGGWRRRLAACVAPAPCVVGRAAHPSSPRPTIVRPGHQALPDRRGGGCLEFSGA